MPMGSGPDAPGGRRNDRMLVILAVGLTLIAFVLWMQYPRDGHRKQALSISCRSNLKQLGVAIGMYQSRNADEMPPDLTTLAVSGILMIGIDEEGVKQNVPRPDTVLTCPERKNETLMTGDIEGTSWYYYARLKDPRSVPVPAEVPIMWEKKQSHPQGVNVLFADLHVGHESAQALGAMIAANARLYARPPVLPEAQK